MDLSVIRRELYLNGRTIPYFNRRIHLCYKTGLVFTVMMSLYFYALQAFFTTGLHYRNPLPMQISYLLYLGSLYFFTGHQSEKLGTLPEDPWDIHGPPVGEPGIVLYGLLSGSIVFMGLTILAGLLQLINYWTVV